MFLFSLLLVSSTFALPTALPSAESLSLNLFENVITPDYNIPDVGDAPEIPYEERNFPTHGYAVDIAFRTTPSDMQCLKSKGYQTVFVRALNPSGDGYFDRDVIDTLHNAYQAGMGSEIYITPLSSSARSGADQVSLVYYNLHSNGINVRSIWIQVTSPSNWSGTMAQRVQFIQDMVQRARDLGLTVGIYTSFYDWLEITGGWNTLSSNILLWYWHVLGAGPSGESETTLTDFRPFGPFKRATVKQFAQVEKVCGMIVNREVYAAMNSAPQEKEVRLTSDAEQEATVRVGAIGI